MRVKSPLVAFVLSVSVAGIATAAAASLGGVNSGTVGADDSVVAACDSNGITISYTTAYNAAAQTYVATAVNFSNVDPACNGKTASVSVRDATTLLAMVTAPSITVTAGAFTLTFGSPVPTSQITGISLAITG